VPLIRLEGVVRIYGSGSADQVVALNGVDLVIQAGEMVAVMGPSGSGKSTLLHIIGCLDRPTRGRYFLRGRPVEDLDEDELARIRNREIGFVFQAFHLLPRATAIENVELPLVYARVPPEERRRRAMEALAMVNLTHRARHRPSELSGGERQRVAIARARVNRPSVILADEPTGNLDSRSSDEVMRILQDLWRQGQTIVVVTHERDIAKYCERVVLMRDGRIVGDVSPSEWE
jgi:putative ABC transport system ATP-binding protein